MPAIFGHDAGWGGWGFCLATEKGPWHTGHVKLDGKAWRWSDMHAQLHEMDKTIAEAATHPEIGAPRIVVEIAPAVYSGRGRESKGNQAATAQGMGQIQGAILAWGTRPGVLPYPWEMEVATWRGWWGIRKWPSRTQYKAAAIRLVNSLGWGQYIEDFPDGGPEHDHAPRSDVAEAILMSVYGARNPLCAPTGPQRDPRWKIAITPDKAVKKANAKP